MSAELHAFLPRGTVPDARAWQAAIAAIGLDVRLDPALDLPRASGFTPVRVRGRETGFELRLDDAAPLVAEYPSVAARASGRERAITFRWGGDVLECAAAMGAAAALVQGFGALAYHPDDDAVYDAESLIDEFRTCME